MTDGTLSEKTNFLHFNNDIGMYFCGKRVNTKNHIYGPEIRRHYIFTLVNNGSAVLHGKKDIHFKKRDMLVVFPNERVHYEAESDWSISWIGVFGKTVDMFMKRLGIIPENPIIHINLYSEILDVFSEMYDLSNRISFENDLFLTSLIYRFFNLLFLNQNIAQKVDAVGTAVKIIDYNYNNNLCVGDISEKLGLNISYFSRKFKETVGVTPKQYIQDKRIERAKYLLGGTNATVTEVSNSVGYDDPLYFSKLFKSETGLSPKKYRERLVEE